MDLKTVKRTVLLCFEDHSAVYVRFHAAFIFKYSSSKGVDLLFREAAHRIDSSRFFSRHPLYKARRINAQIIHTPAERFFPHSNVAVVII